MQAFQNSAASLPLPLLSIKRRKQDNWRSPQLCEFHYLFGLGWPKPAFSENHVTPAWQSKSPLRRLKISFGSGWNLQSRECKYFAQIQPCWWVSRWRPHASPPILRSKQSCAPVVWTRFWNLTTYQFLITSQNAGKGRSFWRQRINRRNPRLNKETKLWQQICQFHRIGVCFSSIAPTANANFRTTILRSLDRALLSRRCASSANRLTDPMVLCLTPCIKPAGNWVLILTNWFNDGNYINLLNLIQNS